MNRMAPLAIVFAVLVPLAGVLAFLVYIATAQPWMGIHFVADPSTGGLTITQTAASGPAADVPAGPVTAISAGGETVALTGLDLVEEPDVLPTRSELEAFFAKQDALIDIARHETVSLTLGGEAGRTFEINPAQARPVSDLPFAFWLQLFVGATVVLIGAWIASLRSRDAGPWLFLIAGLGVAISAFSASIYSTRELALDGELFQLLSRINHFGAPTFGIGMIALFARYPKPILPLRALIAVPVVFYGWYLAEILQLSESAALLFQVPIMIQMILIIVMVLWQWRISRRDPHALAALRWIGTSVVVCAGAFVAIVISPAAFGTEGAIPQGFAFVFFLLIYVGVAIGLRRHRLFEIDAWAFRIMFYTVGAIAFIVLDGLLVLLLGFGKLPSFSLALFAVAILYLPLRDWLWRRTIGRRGMGQQDVFRAVIEVAFRTEPAEQPERWKTLVADLFGALSVEETDTHIEKPRIDESGLRLMLPAKGNLPTIVASYPRDGRGLFGPVQLSMAQNLFTLMGYVIDSRNAFEQGALAERSRIARDLHDDIGSLLTSGLHRTDTSEIRAILRAALAEIRTVVSGLSGRATPLSRIVADLRHETANRVEPAGLELVWPLSNADSTVTRLPYAVHKNLGSIHRELVSNVLRHAKASTITVDVGVSGNILTWRVADDGTSGNDPAAETGGAGRLSADHRAQEMGGEINLETSSSGWSVTLSVPLPEPSKTGQTEQKHAAV